MPLLVFVVGFFVAAPAHAGGVFYADTTNLAASNDNACISNITPCATLDGAIIRVLEQADPNNSTIVAQGTFTGTVTIDNSDLEGLTITAMDAAVPPILDVNGEDYGFKINNVDEVTVSYFEVHNFATSGIYASASATDHNNGLTLQYNTIHTPTTGSTTYQGIYLSNNDSSLIQGNIIRDMSPVIEEDKTYYAVEPLFLAASHSTQIIDNTIERIQPTITFTTDNRSVYSYIYGMYLLSSNHLVITGNTIVDVGAVNTIPAEGSLSYASSYGIYLATGIDETIQNNTIERVYGTVTATGVDAYGAPTTYGIYLGTTSDSKVLSNTVTGLSATATMPEDTNASPYIYGIYVDRLQNVTVAKNTVEDSTATAVTGTGTVKLFSYYLQSIENVIFRQNTSADTAAIHSGAGDASNVALYMIGAPGVNIYHNRLRDFTASTTAVNTTSTSTGIHVTYSTSADIVNNFIYFTNPTVQSSIDGIYVESEQSSPVHVYQNTLHNMLICFDLDYSVSTFIKNNICRMGVDTAYGIEVTTDNYDISTLNSNFNLFYNAAAPVRFNDESSGTLTYEDWKTGVYKMDKKSNEADPKLKLNNPTNLKTYLHLKKTSPAINKGKKNITFTKDDVMSAQILLDWDGYTRVKRPDIGADELKVATKKKKK